MIRLSLKQKLFLSQLVPILTILLLLGLYLILALHTFYIDRLKENMTQTGSLVIDALQADPALADNSSGLQAFLHDLDHQSPIRVQIIDRKGIILASTESEETPLVGTASQDVAVKSALTGRSSNETNPTDLITVALPVTSAGRLGAVRLSLQATDVQAMLNRLNWIIITGTLLLALLSLLVAYTVGVSISKSFRELTQDAAAIAEGNYSHHLDAQGDLEISNLAKTFNGMVDQLAEQRAARQQLLGDVAHELRRPLAAMRAAIEVIQDAALDIPETLQALQDSLLGEMDWLGRLSGRLEYAAGDGYMSNTFKRVPLDITAKIHQVVLFFGPQAVQLGIRLRDELPESLPQVEADPDTLGEVFTNLLDNALKFTPRGGQVCVSAGADQERVWIQVADTGMGLTAEEQNQLFRRFYRGDQKRTRPPGIGLGLAIAQELVQAHGGTIHVSSAADQGTKFLVELPRSAAL